MLVESFEAVSQYKGGDGIRVATSFVQKIAKLKYQDLIFCRSLERIMVNTGDKHIRSKLSNVSH